LCFNLGHTLRKNIGEIKNDLSAILNIKFLNHFLSGPSGQIARRGGGRDI